jgi:hypothetical protein
MPELNDVGMGWEFKKILPYAVSERVTYMRYSALLLMCPKLLDHHSVDSSIKGSATQTAAQVNDLKAGKWYVNLYTAANPGGEAPGQIAVTIIAFTETGHFFGSICP